MPQGTFFNSSAKTIPAVRHFVRVQPGTGWSDSWQYVPFLRFQYCRDGLGPIMPKAGFVYDFGNQKREHTTFFISEFPQSLEGYYVQILLQYAGYDPFPVWHGTFPEESVRLDSDLRLEGQESCTAYGLAHLLDLQTIDRAYCEQDGAVIEVRRLPKFNERREWGNQLIGNRSAARDALSYVFSGRSNRQVWTNLDIVEYLITRFAPTGLTLRLAGLYPTLMQLRDVYDPSRWRSVWHALDELISRKRGLTYQLWTNGAGLIWMWVDSLAERPIAFGGYVLPANSRPLVVNLPSVYPWTHLLDPLDVRFTQLSQCDELTVESEEFMRAMASFSYSTRGKLKDSDSNLRGDGTMVEGWTTSLEGVLKNPPGSTAVERDTSRDDDRFRDVFRKHLIGNNRDDPGQFDWYAGDGTGGGKNAISLRALDNGGVTTGANEWNAEKHLLRELPIESGKRYDVNPVTNENPTEQPPEFIPLLAIMRDPVRSGEFYYLLEKSTDGGPPTMGTSSLDRGLGVLINTQHPQTLARDHWAGAAGTSHPQELDYRDLIITAAIESDEKLRVRFRNLSWPRHHTNRKVHISVPGIHYWRAAPGTIVGVERGALKRIHSGNLTLRDDGAKLRAFATFLAYFFGLHRQTVEIPIKILGLFAPLGAMIIGLQGAQLWQPILTVVTSRTLTRTGTGKNEKMETRIETGFWSIEEARGMFGAL